MRLHAVRVVAEGWDDEGNEVRSVRSSKSCVGTRKQRTQPGYFLGFALALDMAADLEYVRGSRLQHLDAYNKHVTAVSRSYFPLEHIVF